ncbi:hypothetical protein CCYA_CCYA12G3415 [Cyanidiococcus yangmingshanensis]|nr:hypothetical protein CCYA_CCYA12G3415 [Cyanidiococcus yangmingshanensis]
MKLNVSQTVVDTFVVTCIGLAATIVVLEYVVDADDGEDGGDKDVSVDDTVRAQVCATWRTTPTRPKSAASWRDLKFFLDEHVAPELPKLFRLIGQHWLTPKTAWVWAFLSSRGTGVSAT